MKRALLLTVSSILLVGVAYSQWQTPWQCIYSTWDDRPPAGSGPGHQTPSVAVVSEDNFVALVNNPMPLKGLTTPYDNINAYDDSSRLNFLVGYRGARDSASGKLPGQYVYGKYGTSELSGFFTKWYSGFDEVYLWRAWQAAGKPGDDYIYVANADPDNNILVFRLGADSVETTDYRMKTGPDKIFAIDVDYNGYVYVVTERATPNTSKELKVFRGFSAPNTSWATTHDDQPIATIDLPDGIYRGVAVNGPGTLVFVSSYNLRKIFKFVGSPATGYQPAVNFDFHLTAADSIPGTFHVDSATQWAGWDSAGLLGMCYDAEHNLLYATSAFWLGYGRPPTPHNGTEWSNHYSKIWMLNPNTGAVIDTIDEAFWNYMQSGYIGWTNQTGHSGYYASTYDVDEDEKGNIYSQSMYGWTIQKWHYNGTLPVIPITGVPEQTSEAVPSSFALSQNYPNPFNPTTTVEFSVPVATHVTLTVTDLLGRELQRVVDGTMKPGRYRVGIEGSALPSGVYFYTLKAGDFSMTKKMIILR